MFTPRELSVIHSALRYWVGPYCLTQELNQKEKIRQSAALRTAGDLASRFEEILNHYYEMENSHLT